MRIDETWSTDGLSAPVGRELPLEGPSVRRIAAIDGLRAVAVLSVLLYHAGFDLLPGGLAGVDIFFVISGFVVTRSILAESGSGGRRLLALFYARRLRRITPALVVILTLATLAYCLFVPSAWLSQAIHWTDLASFVGLSNVVLSANGDEYFSPVATLNPFTHTWSLGVEEQFYLLLPALLLLSSRLRRGRIKSTAAPAIAFLAILSLIFCALQSQDHQRQAFYSIAARFWELGLGVLLCLTERRWRPLLARVTGAIATLVTLAGVAAILVTLLTPPGLHFPFPIALLCDLGTAAIIAIAVARPTTSAVRAIGIGPLAAVGRGSYSLYLWHWPVIVLMRWTVGLDDLPHRQVAVAVSLALGFACYRLIEQPTQRWRWLRAGPSGQQIRRQILLLATGLVVSEGLLLAKDRISLSRTADVGIWYGGKGDRHVGPPPLHAVAYTRHDIEGGRLSLWSPVRPVATQVFVIGDSHSLPYYPALRRLAEDRGIAIRAYFIPDCSFLPFSKPMRELAICHLAFYRHALREVAASGRKGDVLFLPNLRLPRYVDQWGPVRSWSMTDAGAPERRARATVEALALLRPVAARGVTILFESPTPIFRSVPFRCADWFNRGNPVCAAGFTVQRSEMDALRSAPLEQMRTIADQLPGVRIWNAFDLLCPGDPCSAFRGDRPLFMDGDHLSGFSVSLIYPSLKDAILAASAFPNGSPPRRRPAP